MQLRAGSNSFHGVVSEFMRSDKFNARNFFSAPSSPKPELKRNQFGSVVSGPIRQNGTFFMGSYEGVRETRESVAQTNFLTEAMRRGDFSGLAAIRDPLTGQPFPGNIIPAPRLDPKSVDMINKYQPLPNTTGPNNFIGTTLNTQSSRSVPHAHRP